MRGTATRVVRVGITLMVVLGASLPGSASAAPMAPRPDAPNVSSALSAGQLDLRTIASGLTAPIGVTNAGDGTNRLFVVERRGTVRVVSGGQLQAGFFLDIRTNSQGGLSSGGEQGLLGLAFHPDFETNEKLFVYFTRGDGDLVIAEMTANAARTSANVSTLDPIISPIEHSAFGNHNGGQLLFVGDHLYIFTGDGGSGGDPAGNGQNPNSRLGKILRVTPNLDGGVTIPSDNPYVGASGDDAVWAIGLRNPWRASRDGATGNLWIADVGQNRYEEINREPASTGGRDYGWDDCEGAHAFEGSGCPGLGQSSGVRQAPIAEYSHTYGCSVTGGHVYRGSKEPDLVGNYVLADFCSGRLWTIPSSGSGLVFHRDTTRSISSFGEGESKELYAVDIANGTLYLVVAPPYADITNSFFYDDIKWLAEQSITGGCATRMFCPTRSVTRGQMASFLARALNLPSPDGDYFTDDEDSIHEFDINRLATANITGGCAAGADNFCPSLPVGRGQMASFLSRALDLPPASTDYFDDDNSSIFESDINRVKEAGIAGGCATRRYCPAAPVTREQMAAFLRRAFE